MTKTLIRRKSGITRREFVGTVAPLAAFTIVPRHVLGGPGHVPPVKRSTWLSLVLGDMEPS